MLESSLCMTLLRNRTCRRVPFVSCSTECKAASFSASFRFLPRPLVARRNFQALPRMWAGPGCHPAMYLIRVRLNGPVVHCFSGALLMFALLAKRDLSMLVVGEGEGKRNIWLSQFSCRSKSTIQVHSPVSTMNVITQGTGLFRCSVVTPGRTCTRSLGIRSASHQASSSPEA